jgi:hypothetical protein
MNSFAGAAIWLNLLVVFLSVGFIALSPSNYTSAEATYEIPAGSVIKQDFTSYPFVRTSSWSEWSRWENVRNGLLIEL